MEVTSVIALLALALSLFSLGWQMRRAWWEKPVVVVSGRQHPYETDGEPLRHELTLVVSNVGERPVTVVDFGWYYGAGTHWHDIERPLVKADLPYRLEPHDRIDLSGFVAAAEAWKHPNQPLMVKDEISGEMRQGARPFVTVVQRPTRGELRRGVQAERRVYGPPQIITNEGL